MYHDRAYTPVQAAFLLMEMLQCGIRCRNRGHERHYAVTVSAVAFASVAMQK